MWPPPTRDLFTPSRPSGDFLSFISPQFFQTKPLNACSRWQSGFKLTQENGHFHLFHFEGGSHSRKRSFLLSSFAFAATPSLPTKATITTTTKKTPSKKSNTTEVQEKHLVWKRVEKCSLGRSTAYMGLFNKFLLCEVWHILSKNISIWGNETKPRSWTKWGTQCESVSDYIHNEICAQI